jgi:hypothetical protein
MGRVHIEAVPPEEFAFAKGSKSVKESGYHRRKRKVFVADLCRQFPDRKDKLKERSPKSQEDTTNDSRVSAREADSSARSDPTSTVGREQCDLIEEFIRIDWDCDDVVELRSIKRVDDIILENEAVEASEFVVWTPFRMSHKIDGRSMHDVLKDLQKIRTVITRRYLDGLGQTLTPRTYVNLSAVDEDMGTLAALMANKIGGVIPVKGDARQAVQEMTSPDVSGSALNALEFFDQRVQEASGVNKQSQGMDPQAMNKTATGIDLLQAAAKTRIEMVATWLGFALEDVFSLALKQLVAHQDAARQVKLFGSFVPVDPRRWRDDAAISVHVGSAGVSRQQRLLNLQLIATKQENILMTAGPQNPMVQLSHYRATLSQICSVMGFKDTSLFFGEVPPDYQPPPPPPDPKQAAEQAKMQAEMAKLQLAQQKAEQAAALAQQVADNKIKLAIEEANAKHALEIQKAKFEAEHAQEQMRAEFALERMRMESRARVDSEKAQLDNNRPGGRLDA